MNVLMVSGMAGVKEAMDRYHAVQADQITHIRRASHVIGNDDALHVVYADDTAMGSVDELWALIGLCQQRNLRVFVSILQAGRSLVPRLRDLGIPFQTDDRTPQDIVKWLTARLGVSEQTTQQLQIAIGSSKGGAGKTATSEWVSTGLAMRGYRPLMLDGDISNANMAQAFRIARRQRGYLHALRDGGDRWADPAHLAEYVYFHDASRVSFLLGSDSTSDTAQDLSFSQWEELMRGVKRLMDYPIALIDTGPEIKRRPYALETMRQGGWTIVPIQPTVGAREGAINALDWFKDDNGVDHTSRCCLLFIEPERGYPVTVPQILPTFQDRYPDAHVLGVVPRAPAIIGRANEHPSYVSPLLVSEHAEFTVAVHEIIDRLCGIVGLEVRPITPRKRGLLARTFTKKRGQPAPQPRVVKPA